MIIEEGKFYRDGFGYRVGPMRCCCLGMRRLWMCENTKITYISSGHRSDTFISGFDLIKEWTDEPAPIPGLIVTKHPVTRADILSEAGKAVADRGLNYGAPEDSFESIARLWRAHLMNSIGNDAVISGADVAIMLALVKIARLETNPTHIDSWVDLAGYAACGGEIAGVRSTPS